MGCVSSKQNKYTQSIGAGGGAGGGAGAMVDSYITRRGATAVRASSTNHFLPDNQAVSQVISGFLSTAEIGVFSQLNRTCYTDVKHELNKRAAKRLLDRTVKGKEQEAQSVLEANSKLLLSNDATTTDFSGKKSMI